MSYKDWLINKYLEDETVIGDFARDVEFDNSFPTSSDENTIYDYLSLKHVGVVYLTAFRASYKEYEIEEG